MVTTRLAYLIAEKIRKSLILFFDYLIIIQSLFKSLIETCPYIILRRRHVTGEPNSSRTPIDSPVFQS